MSDWPSTQTTHRFVRSLCLVAFLGWAVYTGLLTSGHFLSILPAHRAETAWLILIAVGCLIGATGVVPRNAVRQQEQPEQSLTLLPLVFIPLSLALYAPTLTLGLLSDDFTLSSRAAALDFFNPSFYFRPVPLLIWAALQHISSAPFCLHALNVFVHGVNGSLVVVLAHRLRLSRLTTAVAGLLFVCFPASVEPVAWPSGVQDLLLTMFCLTFVLACTLDSPLWAAILGLTSLTAALGTKETSVVLPALALVGFYGTRRRPRIVLVAASALATFSYLLFRLLVLRVDTTFAVPPSRYLLKELLCRPFAALAVPFTTTELLSHPALGVLLAWLALALFSSAIWRRALTTAPRSIELRCTLWVLLSAAPVYRMFFISSDLQGSRYLYLGSCAWAILVAVTLLEQSHQPLRRLGFLLSIGLLLLWTLGVHSHLADWHQASVLRDRVLAASRSVLQTTACAAVRFDNLPDSVGGAYVFRNGFDEALQRSGPHQVRAAVGAGDPACTVRWDGVAFR